MRASIACAQGVSPGRAAGADRLGARDRRRSSARRPARRNEIGPGDLAGQRGAAELGDRAQIVGHDPRRGDAAVEVAAHHAPRRARRSGGVAQMLVAVDQAGQQIAAAQGRRAARRAIRPAVSSASGSTASIRSPSVTTAMSGARRPAGAVDQRGAAIDDAAARGGRRERRLARLTAPGRGEGQAPQNSAKDRQNPPARPSGPPSIAIRIDPPSRARHVRSARAIPAATLVLMRERADGPPELLVTERTGQMAFAAGALVFPGGRIDADDHRTAERLLRHCRRAARIAAIRETIEETGIAPGLSPAPDAAGGRRAARGHRRRASPSPSLLDGARPRRSIADALTPFARWCPNFRETRRFDTLFFLAEAPAGRARADASASMRRSAPSGRARPTSSPRSRPAAPMSSSRPGATSSGSPASARSPRRAPTPRAIR